MPKRIRGLGVIGVAVLAVGAVSLLIALGLLFPRPADPAPATLLASSSPAMDWETTTTTSPPTTTVPPTTAAPAPQAPQATHVQQHSAPAHNYAAGAGGFASCVRQKESGGDYGYSGYYHGAYNMTLSHWGGYGGYSRPEDAPPSVQDAKFQDDMSHGSAYIHQQYPQTSRMCGG